MRLVENYTQIAEPQPDRQQLMGAIFLNSAVSSSRMDFNRTPVK
jgi:hypothetical protein